MFMFSMWCVTITIIYDLLYVCYVSISISLFSGCSSAYYGKEMCTLQGRMHGVSGTVYAVDDKHLFIKNLNYDGKAPGNFCHIKKLNAKLFTQLRRFVGGVT